MLRSRLCHAVPRVDSPSLAFCRINWRSYTNAFTPPKPDNVLVQVGASGAVSLDIYHPPRPQSNSPVIINFPRGPVESKGSPLPTNLAPLAIAANKTVVQVHYRLSKERRFPLPIHDALAAYDWVVKHLISTPSTSDGESTQDDDATSGQIGVCGELIGGTIAAALGLTECHMRGPRVSAMLLSNPISDWTAMHPVQASLPSLTSPPPPPTPKGRGRGKRKAAIPSWEEYALSSILPTTALLKARTTLFPSAGGYFDPFASPLLFFRTPSTEVPGDVDPLEELFAEMEGVVRMQDKKSKSARVYPPKGTELVLPKSMVWVGRENVLCDQGMELRKALTKTAGAENVEWEAKRGVGLWEMEDLAYIGRWFDAAFRRK